MFFANMKIVIFRYKDKAQRQLARMKNYEMPKQIRNNPYNTNTMKMQNRPLANFRMGDHHESIDKCAVTEISCSEEPYEDKQQITQICQSLFQNQPKHQNKKYLKNSSFEERSKNVLAEATFKPYQLKRELQAANARDNFPIKTIIRNNLNSMPKLNKNQSEPNFQQRKHQNKALKLVKQKIIQEDLRKLPASTKYEKILKQYFNNKGSSSNKKLKVSIEKVPNYRLRTYEEEDQQKQNQNINFKRENNARFNHNNQMLNINELLQNYSHKDHKHDFIKGITRNSRNDEFTNGKDNTLGLKKTFSQFLIKTEECESTDRDTRRMSERWMSMTFEERQRKTLQNRKSKEHLGKKLNEQKERNGCTFQPKLTEFKLKTQMKKPQSYAKMYYEKIRRRF